MKLVSVTCEGQTYARIKDLAKHYGVHPSTVGRRLRDGWTPEQSVGINPRKRLGHGLSIVFDGIKYNDLKSLAEAHGLDGGTLRARLYYGYSLKDAVKGNMKPRLSAMAKAVMYRGKRYASQKELAESFGLTDSVVSRRLKNGWTRQQALGTKPPPPRFRNHEGHAREMKWKTTRPASSKLGFEPVPDAKGFKLYLITNLRNGKQYVGSTIGALEDRWRQHVSAARRGRKAPFPNAIRCHGEDCFKIELLRSDAKTFDELQEQEIQEIEARKTIKVGYNVAIGGALGTPKPILVAGLSFASRTQAAQHFGVDTAVFSLRLERLKWSPEEAAGLVQRQWSGKAQEVLVNGIRYRSILEASSAFGKDHRSTYDRLSKGWLIEQALDMSPPPETVKYSGVAITVNGVDYPSTAAATAALGISCEAFRKRICSGMTPDEAYRRARRKNRNPVRRSC